MPPCPGAHPPARQQGRPLSTRCSETEHQTQACACTSQLLVNSRLLLAASHAASAAAAAQSDATHIHHLPSAPCSAGTDHNQGLCHLRQDRLQQKQGRYNTYAYMHFEQSYVYVGCTAYSVCQSCLTSNLADPTLCSQVQCIIALLPCFLLRSFSLASATENMQPSTVVPGVPAAAAHTAVNPAPLQHKVCPVALLTTVPVAGCS